MKRWWRGTFGLVAAVALGFALATLVIGVVVHRFYARREQARRERAQGAAIAVQES